MNIGSLIKEARKRASLTQVELAEQTGIAVNSVRLYEGGYRSPNLQTLEKIAFATSVSADLFTNLGNWENILSSLQAVLSPGDSPIELISLEMGIDFEAAKDVISSGVDSLLSQRMKICAKMLQRDFESLNKKTNAAQAKRNEHFDRITKYLSLLNDEGQRVAADRVQELTEIPKYQADK